jgi:quinolinate synthase
MPQCRVIANQLGETEIGVLKRMALLTDEEMLYKKKSEAKRCNDMETIKTALFETLLESAVADENGGFTFTLEGKTYRIKDTLEISKIAQDHGYIIIY